MEYVWIIILVGVYMAVWLYVYDNWHEVYWERITFPKVWVYIHFIALVLGIVALFIVSLTMFVQGRK